MEPISFIVGVSQLATVFTACLELTELIHLGQNLGPDYQVLYTKFLLLRYRLFLWGKSLNELQNSPQWSQTEENLFGNTLVIIQSLFNDTKALKQKYGLENHELQQVLQTRPAQAISSTGLAELQLQFDVTSAYRQKKTTLKRKTSWAVRDKQAFERLISQFAFYVDQLETITQKIRATDMQMMLADRINMIQSTDAVALLQEAVATPDISRRITAQSVTYIGSVPDTDDVEIIDVDDDDDDDEEDEEEDDRHYNSNNATSGNTSSATFHEETIKPTATTQHRYINTVINGRARVLNGDAGNVQKSARHHFYVNMRIGGDAQVLQGNADLANVRAFFGR